MYPAFEKSFLDMVAALRLDSSISVAIAELVAPDVGQIQEVEASLGYSLGESLTAFYTFCGGIKLVWTYKDPEEDGIWDAEKAANVFADPASDRPWLFKSGDLTGAPAGCIWIPSCKQVFGSGKEWADLLSEQADVFEDYRSQIGQPVAAATEQLLPFDYSSAFYDVVFLMNGSAEPKLIRGEDNGASFADSRVVTLNEYLELLITSKGVIAARINALASE